MTVASSSSQRRGSIALWTKWALVKQRPHHFVDVASALGFDVDVFSAHNFRAAGEPVREERAPRTLASVRQVPNPLRSIGIVRNWDERRIDRLMSRFTRCAADVHVYGAAPRGVLDRKPSRLVYDCMDDWAGFPGAKPELNAREHELCEMADRIWTSSRWLYEKHAARYSAKLRFVPNGVDFSHFARVPLLRAGARSARPVLGYVGAIYRWFDTDLVSEVARLLPDWEIVLVGPVALSKAARARLNRPNVRLLGRQPYARLPELMASFDVAMIPFILSDLTHGTNPCKLNEYLAAGLPVIATPMAEVASAQERGAVVCCESATDFAREVVQLAAAGEGTRRQHIARAHDWRAIFASAIDEIA